MKAALLKQTGSIDELEKNLVVEEISLPEISNDEVLIKLKNSSLNHRDLYITNGLYSKIKLPVVLGSDGAGIVHSKGKNVSSFEIGEEVIINPGMNWGNNENYQSANFKILGMPDNGTLAEFISVNKSYVYKKPEHLSFAEASVFPLAGVTAYCALFKKANLNKNDNLLITGIGGGVSGHALVFALKIEANVFVTSGSDDKIKKAISLGARAGVNYKNENWKQEIIELSDNKINVVIDGTGGDSFSKILELCNYGSRIISYGATLGNVKDFPLARLFWKQLKIFGSTMGSPKDFADMLKFINENKITPVIDKIFSLNNICDAFKRMNDSEQFGKIVIEI
ncbi:MAG: zinc-binding dehydrogenase [Bacteroidota bacterium]|nr:zinc-binding dehydrogenase [Bacteroidota bacterium]